MEPQATVPAPSTTQTSSQVPNSWPGAFGMFKTAKNAYMVNLGPNLIILVISLLAGLALPNVLGNSGRLIGELIAIALSVASTVLYLAGAQGQKLALGDAFPKDFMMYVKYVGLSLLIALSAAVSFLLLIIPFFIVIPRLTLATYFLVDKDMGVVEAYKASWNATKGQAGKVWGIIGAAIVFALLCLVIIGIYLSIMYSTIFALLYLFLQKQPAAASVQADAPVAPTVAAPQV